MMRLTNSIAFLCVLSSSVAVAQPGGEFCAQIKNLPIANYNKTAKALHKIETTRTSGDDGKGGRSIPDIEKAIAPYNLSEPLKQIFIENEENSDTDYNVFKTDKSKVVQFQDVQGSLKCSYDIWAIKKGSVLEPVQDGPDLGEACDVVRIFGSLNDIPVLVQYTFQSGDDSRNSPAADKIIEVRAVELVPEMIKNVCVIHPK